MKDFRNVFLKIVKKDYFVYIWLFGLAFLSFGILIPALGFYWDDLPYLYQYSAFGPQGFPAYVSSDRPFSAWIFSTTTALFGYNPLGYHILALILRWLCSVLLFQILREIWPNNREANVAAASVLAVYPGFLQQPIALIYNHHFSVLAMFLASLLLMAKNIRKQKPDKVLFLFSLLLSLSMFSIENFATLELIRPFILWKLLKPKIFSPKARFKKVILNWVPYLIIFIIFVIWRVVIFKFPTYKPSGINEILTSPLKAVVDIASRIPQDFYTLYLSAWWFGFFIPTIQDFGKTATFLFWAVSAAATTISITFYSLLTHKPSSEETQETFNSPVIEMLAASVVLFLLAGSIVWGLALPVENLFAWDRMSLAFIPGIALLVGAIFLLLRKRRFFQIFLMVLLILFSSAKNYQNGITFKRDWENLQALLSQLSWRIPALIENTIFITSEPGLNYYSDNSLTAPINLQYSEDISSQSLAHFVYYTNARTQEWFENDLYESDYKRNYRSFTFHGNTANAISIQFAPPGCMKILDQVFYNSVTTPNLTDRQVKEMRFTNLDIISTKSENAPFTPMFTESPTDSWCYFFEKADLARQMGDYQGIIQLAGQVEEGGFGPRAANEWLPFLEGYLRSGDFESAEKIVSKILNAEGNYKSGLCYTLRRIEDSKEFPYREDLNTLQLQIDCD